MSRPTARRRRRLAALRTNRPATRHQSPHQPFDEPATSAAATPPASFATPTQATRDQHHPKTKRCETTTARGEPCRAFARGASNRCIFHDPDYRETHLSNSARGGRRTGKLMEQKREDVRPLDLTTGEARASVLGYVVSAALTGKLSGSQLAIINRAMSLVVRDAASSEQDTDLTTILSAISGARAL